MGLVRVTSEQVAATAVEALGLDSQIVDFGSPEVLAAAVRRAASFTCPASPRLLTLVVEESLRGLVNPDQAETGAPSPVRAILDDLVGYGDLLEAPVLDGGRGTSHRTLFLGQPAFVRVSDSGCLLMGVRAEGLTLLDEALMERIDHDAHVRRIELRAGEDPRIVFGSSGLRERTTEQWLNHPLACLPEVLLAEYDALLTSSGPSGTIDGCRLLDPSKAVTYYHGRWRTPTSKDIGRFIIRHPLEFGSDAWAYAELHHGEVQKLVDLPVRQRLDRACDEAWRLQAAIDCLARNPQRIRVEHAAAGRPAQLHLLSPVPSWAQRRLDAIGRALPRRRGSLMSYSVAEAQVAEELSFLSQLMWTEHDKQGGM